jgi:hypothetical protein
MSRVFSANSLGYYAEMGDNQCKLKFNFNFYFLFSNLPQSENSDIKHNDRRCLWQY